jgi:uncharacterized protein YbaP (TraB family)
MSRNNERVLSDQMISDIKAEMFGELELGYEREMLIETMMNAYLTNDFDSLKQVIVDNIEHYEDEIILTLNMELAEDAFNQAEND